MSLISSDLSSVNQTEYPYSSGLCLHQLLEAQAALTPEVIAVVGEADLFWAAESLSYARLNHAANQVAARLRGQGIGPGQIVGVLTERSLAMVVGIFGILKAGAAYLPLSPEDPAERLSFVLDDAAVPVLLVHQATAAKAPPGVPVLNLESAELYVGPGENLGATAGPRDLAYVIYTSGSTGKPKGVLIEHHSAVNRLEWMQRAYPIGPGDVLLQKTA